MEGLAEIITDFFNSIGQKQTSRHPGHVRFPPESGQAGRTFAKSA
jgi:hypothetical protein